MSAAHRLRLHDLGYDDRYDVAGQSIPATTMKPRHALAFALVGATLGLLVPVSLLTLARVGIGSFESSFWMWPSIIMFLSLDRCCGQRPPTHEVILVWTESLAMNVLIYSVLSLLVGSCVTKLWNVLKAK
jgi:hypothetical protein